MRHSFRKSNQLPLHHEHCLHLNKGMHRSRRNMSSHCVWLSKVLTVHHKTVTVESELVFTCYPSYLRNMCSLRSVSYSLHGNYALSILSTKSTILMVFTPFHTWLQNYGTLFWILLEHLTFLISRARFYSMSLFYTVVKF